MIPTDAPFRSSRMTVQDDWIDYNGHMNVAYYVILLDRAVDEAFAALGLGPDYVRERNNSFFTVELHVSYLRELAAGAPVQATLQFLACDDKRVRAYLELRHAEEDFVSATAELLFLHVDLAARRAAPFPDDVMANVRAGIAAHRALPWPERAGRAITLAP